MPIVPKKEQREDSIDRMDYEQQDQVYKNASRNLTLLVQQSREKAMEKST